MDNIVSLYTTTEGRIGRGRWWLGVVILIVINIVISLFLLPLVGVSMMPNMMAFADPNADFAALSATMAAGMRTAGWASLIQFLVFAYPSYALSVKRRHDKDNSGMDVMIYYGLTAIVLLINALGIGYSMVEVPGVAGFTIPQPSMPISILGFAIGIFGLYLLVVMGFLKGTAGPNKFGPDPLGGTAAA